MVKKQIILSSAMKLAHVYFNTGENLCMAKTTKINAEEWPNYIVGYTNMAFACEVSLKAIIKETGGGEPQEGHNLKKLFETINKNWRGAISELVIAKHKVNGTSDYTLERFKNDLEEYSNAFVTGRYWYEFTPSEKKKKRRESYL